MVKQQETARQFAEELVSDGYRRMDDIDDPLLRAKLAALVLKEKGFQWIHEAFLESKNTEQTAYQVNVLMAQLSTLDFCAEAEQYEKVNFSLHLKNEIIDNLISGATRYAKNACDLLLESVAAEFDDLPRFDPEKEYGVRKQGEI